MNLQDFEFVRKFIRILAMTGLKDTTMHIHFDLCLFGIAFTGSYQGYGASIALTLPRNDLFNQEQTCPVYCQHIFDKVMRVPNEYYELQMKHVSPTDDSSSLWDTTWQRKQLDSVAGSGVVILVAATSPLHPPPVDLVDLLMRITRTLVIDDLSTLPWGEHVELMQEVYERKKGMPWTMTVSITKS
jgi:hypothetical protein